MHAYKYLRAVRQLRINRRHVLYGTLMAALLLASSLSLIKLGPYTTHGNEHYFRAKVVAVQNGQPVTLGSTQSIKARLLDGPDKGKTVAVQRTPIGDAAGKRLPVDSEILLAKGSATGDQYSYLSRWYMPGVGTLFTILLLLGCRHRRVAWG